MGLINANVTVDLARKIYNMINVVQNDTGRSITFKILDNGIIYNLTGFTIRAYTTTECYKDLSIVNATGGTCRLDIDNSMIDKQGEIDLQLRLLKDSKMVTSFSIKIKAEKSLVDDSSVQSSNKLSALDTALNKVQTWNNYFKETSGQLEEKYTERLTEVESREYGAENLLLDSGFLSGNIGNGFPWNKNNENTTVKIVESDSAKSGKSARITSTTGDAGICQNVTYNRDFKSSYTVSFRVYGTKDTIIKVNLSNVQTIQYTIKTDDAWEDVNITFTSNTDKWNKMLYIVSSGAATFYLQDIALWEGKNSFTYRHNSNECLYNRIIISGQNVLKITESGKYAGVGCTNNPFGNNSEWAYYDIDVHSATYKKIKAYSYSTNGYYMNTMSNGTWTGWQSPELQAFPIGSIKLSNNNVNPGTYLLGSTWTLVGQGLTLVGVGTGKDSNGISKTFTAGNNAGKYQDTNTHNHSLVGVSTVANTAGGYVVGNSNNVADTTITIDTVNPSYGVYIWLRTA